MSEAAQSLVGSLLVRVPEQRLGCSEVAAEDGLAIAAHPFFKSIDYDKLERMELTPPYIPRPDNNAVCLQ